MGGLLAQFFPGRPPFTEANLPSLVGKVFIVTGGNSGVGFELVKILYSAGGTVYIASRSPAKIAAAIKNIEGLPRTTSAGQLKSLVLDLGDLSTILACASAFLAQESRLDVLWNNAGISRAPLGSQSAQGHEAHIGTNCLGHFLLTKLLLPVLVRTAKSAPKDSVRVVFASSGIIDIAGPPGGLSLAEITAGGHTKDIAHNYSASKAGDWFLASELDRRMRGSGIVSIAQSPGTLKTKGWDDVHWAMKFLMRPVMYEPKLGAYTELWAGLSGQVTAEDGGRFAIPWGRWHPSPRKDVLESLKGEAEGGTGVAEAFWEWCEVQTEGFVESGR